MDLNEKYKDRVRKADMGDKYGTAHAFSIGMADKAEAKTQAYMNNNPLIARIITLGFYLFVLAVIFGIGYTIWKVIT